MTDLLTDPQETDDPSGPRLPDALSAVLSALGAGSVDGLTDSELTDVISLLEATKGAAAALQARATARFVEDRDARVAEAVVEEDLSRRQATNRRRATRCEVALARRCAPGQADRHVGIARALVHELPCTMAALTAGEISEWRATIVARETACLSPDDRREADRRLSADLTTLGDKALAAAAHRICIDLDQEAIVERRRRAAASRRVSVRPAPDGMAWLSVLGPVADVVGAFAALRAAEQARHVATGDPEVDAARAADERGQGAWLADTALELLSGRSAGQVQPVEVCLVMSESVIVPGAGAGAGAGAGTSFFQPEAVEVPGWGPMPAAAAREHLVRILRQASGSGSGDPDDSGDPGGHADAGLTTGTGVWLRRLWTSPDGRDLVAMDSRRRLFHGGLRRLIELRDQICRVPWCDAPVVEIDHVVSAARGGATSAANGMGVCQRHNLAKEEPGWSAEVVATGVDPDVALGSRQPHQVVLRTPTGGEYRSVAPPVLGVGRDPVPARSEGSDSVAPDSAGHGRVATWGHRQDVHQSPLEVYLAGLAA